MTRILSALLLDRRSRSSVFLAASALLFCGMASDAKTTASDKADDNEEVVTRGTQDEAETTAQPPEEPAPSAPAPQAAPRLQVHGFLTQAYAEADYATGGFEHPTGEELVLGIPEDGTTDYRALALQIRYQMSPNNSTVLQLSHRRFGDSPIGEVEDDVQIDWAFYEHRIGSSSYLKVGRMPMPLGLFNEIRDVGTLLPFFRAPYGFYREGSFTSETIDGAMFGHSFRLGTWDLGLDVYGGGFSLIEFPIPGSEAAGKSATLARAKDALGMQIWLYAPIDGVRFGVGANRFSPSGGFLEQPGTTTDWWGWHASFEAALQHVVLRTEYRTFYPESNLHPTVEDVVPGYYVQLGYHFNDHWRIYAQHEEQRSKKREIELFLEPARFTFYRDTAVALDWAFRSDVVVKLEQHFLEIGTLGAVPVFGEGRFLGLQPIYRTAKDGRQTILSLAVSF